MSIFSGNRFCCDRFWFASPSIAFESLNVFRRLSGPVHNGAFSVVKCEYFHRQASHGSLTLRIWYNHPSLSTDNSNYVKSRRQAPNNNKTNGNEIFPSFYCFVLFALSCSILSRVTVELYEKITIRMLRAL